jgi:hypothetical protein
MFSVIANHHLKISYFSVQSMESGIVSSHPIYQRIALKMERYCDQDKVTHAELHQNFPNSQFLNLLHE